MKTILTSIILLFLGLQQSEAQKPYKYYEKDKATGQKIYGFIDMDKEKTLIAPQFYNANEFREGLAAVAVKKEGKVLWGYIDITGKFVLPPKYEDALDFSEGLAGVKMDGKYGFINKQGEVFIPFKYPRVDNFVNHVAMVWNPDLFKSTYGLVNRLGYEIVPLGRYTSKFTFNGDFAVVFAQDTGVNGFFGGGKAGLLHISGIEAVPLGKMSREDPSVKVGDEWRVKVFGGESLSMADLNNIILEKAQNDDSIFFKLVMYLALNGNEEGYYHLGARLLSGRGVAKNIKAALYWLNKSAETGNADAMNDMGICFQTEKKNYAEALKWFKKAADLGNGHAYYNLYLLYNSGDHVEKDEQLARKYLQIAAEKGVPKAKELLQ